MSDVRKYLSRGLYWNKLLKVANSHVLHRLDCAMAPPEHAGFRYPPVFVIGAPRCGSTLIFQVLTDAFDIGYLSNTHCRFFGAPALAERLLRPVANKPASDYRSEHGNTRQGFAPSECWQWWYRFFPRDPVYTASDADQTAMRCFRRSLLALTVAFDKPVAFKNLYAGMRLRAITKHVPEALFVVVQRNELDNAASLLKARMQVHGNYDSWFSVPPPGVESLRSLPAAEQVVRQIRSIHETIEHDLQHTAGHKVLKMDYEEWCTDVHEGLRKFASFLAVNGVTVRHTRQVPSTFERAPGNGLPAKLHSELLQCIKR